MQIQFLNGENAGTVREIDPAGVGIGRETDNGIQLLGGRVSRYHARLELRQQDWYILDLGSTNGTKVNGKSISGSVRLQHGDVVAVGEIMFRIDDTAGAAKNPETGNGKETEQEPVKKQVETPAFVFRPPENHDSPSVRTAKTPLPGFEAETKPASEPENKNPEQKPSGTIPDLEHLFKREATSHAEAAALKSPSGSRKRIFNLLFLLLVVSVAAMSLIVFVLIQNPENRGRAGVNREQAASIPNPFFIFYEKRQITTDNHVFCFRLLLENDQLTFSLDDLLSGRAYSPPNAEPVRPEAIEKLKKAIADTNFMTSTQQERLSDSSENDKNYARLVIGFDDKFNDITVQDIVLTSFTRVEAAIREFLQEEFDLDPSMMESRDELIRVAKNIFDLAEKQYRDYKTQPENLWRAIENYKIVLRRYEVFAEKPPEWEIARAHLAEAEAVQEEIREKGHGRVNLLYQQREFREAIAECIRLMEYFAPDSKTYKNIRDQKIKLEKLMSKDK